MTYITEGEYTKYSGRVPPDDFAVLAARASDQIDMLVGYKIQQLDTLPSFVQQQIKLAVCAQAAYLDANGGLDALTDDGITSAGLGKFTYTGGGNGTRKIASTVIHYLAPTGLLYTGMGVIR